MSQDLAMPWTTKRQVKRLDALYVQYLWMAQVCFRHWQRRSIMFYKMTSTAVRGVLRHQQPHQLNYTQTSDLKTSCCTLMAKTAVALTGWMWQSLTLIRSLSCRIPKWCEWCKKCSGELYTRSTKLFLYSLSISSKIILLIITFTCTKHNTCIRLIYCPDCAIWYTRKN